MMRFPSQFLNFNFRKRLKLILVFLFVLFVMGFLVNFIPRSSDIRYCFTNPKPQLQNSLPSHVHLLEDVLLAEVKPIPGRSIFFHETTCHQTPQKLNIWSLLGGQSSSYVSQINEVTLNARQACAIESAARHNANSTVFVLFTSPVYINNNSLTPQLRSVLAYSNVHLRNLNLWTYSAGTPIYSWFKDGKLFESSYVLSHISDFLRYLTLWRWGGTYLDMDVVVVRKMEKMLPNYAGSESNSHLASGVMNFAPDNFGHDIATSCLLEFQHSFDGSDWGYNGPGVITRVMHRICGTNDIKLMVNNSERCRGFHVYSKDAFYAIPWFEWEHFFDPLYSKQTFDRIQNSYLIHVWNKHSHTRTVKITDTESVYGQIAAKNCPRVFRTTGDYF